VTPHPFPCSPNSIISCAAIDGTKCRSLENLLNRNAERSLRHIALTPLHKYSLSGKNKDAFGVTAGSVLLCPFHGFACTRIPSLHLAQCRGGVHSVHRAATGSADHGAPTPLSLHPFPPSAFPAHDPKQPIRIPPARLDRHQGQQPQSPRPVRTAAAAATTEFPAEISSPLSPIPPPTPFFRRWHVRPTAAAAAAAVRYTLARAQTDTGRHGQTQAGRQAVRQQTDTKVCASFQIANGGNKRRRDVMCVWGSGSNPLPRQSPAQTATESNTQRLTQSPRTRTHAQTNAQKGSGTATATVTA
jgi:hypothetical protein